MSLDSTVLALSPSFYWPMDDPVGSSICADASGNENALTNSGMTLGEAGIVPSDSETCALLPASASSTVATSTYKPSIPSSVALSVMMIFQCSTAPSSLTQLLNNLSGTTSGMSLRFNSTGNVAWVLANGTSDATATSTVTITAGHSYMVVGTYSSSTMSLYLYDLTSGTSYSAVTAALTNGSFAPTNNWGTGQVSGFPRYQGRVAFFPSALTFSQVTSLYTAATVSSGTTYGKLGAYPQANEGDPNVFVSTVGPIVQCSRYIGIGSGLVAGDTSLPSEGFMLAYNTTSRTIGSAAITAASNSGTTVTMTAATATMVAGNTVVISGISDAGGGTWGAECNGPQTVTSVSGNNFSFVVGTAPTGTFNSSGTTAGPSPWELVGSCSSTFNASIYNDIKTTAQAINSLGVPVYVGYDNEWDSASLQTANGQQGGQYAAAYATWAAIMRTYAPQAILICCLSGDNLNSTVQSWMPSASLYDVLCFDPYDAQLTYGSPLERWSIPVNWATTNNVAPGKKLGIFETGVRSDINTDAQIATWIAGMGAAAQTLNLEFVMWFNANNTSGLGDTVILYNAAITAASNSGTTVTMTTSWISLKVGQVVTIAGISDSGGGTWGAECNGSQTLTSVTSTTFSFVVGTAPTGTFNASGATVGPTASALAWRGLSSSGYFSTPPSQSLSVRAALVLNYIQGKKISVKKDTTNFVISTSRPVLNHFTKVANTLTVALNPITRSIKKRLRTHIPALDLSVTTIRNKLQSMSISVVPNIKKALSKKVTFPILLSPYFVRAWPHSITIGALSLAASLTRIKNVLVYPAIIVGFRTKRALSKTVLNPLVVRGIVAAATRSAQNIATNIFLQNNTFLRSKRGYQATANVSIGIMAIGRNINKIVRPVIILRSTLTNFSIVKYISTAISLTVSLISGGGQFFFKAISFPINMIASFYRGFTRNLTTTGISIALSRKGRIIPVAKRVGIVVSSRLTLFRLKVIRPLISIDLRDTKRVIKKGISYPVSIAVSRKKQLYKKIIGPLTVIGRILHLPKKTVRTRVIVNNPKLKKSLSVKKKTVVTTVFPIKRAFHKPLSRMSIVASAIAISRRNRFKSVLTSFLLALNLNHKTNPNHIPNIGTKVSVQMLLIPAEDYPVSQDPFLLIESSPDTAELFSTLTSGGTGFNFPPFSFGGGGGGFVIDGDDASFVNRTATATVAAAEWTIFTGSTSAQTLTLPATPSRTAANKIANYASVSVTIAPNTNQTLSVFGQVGNLILGANTEVELIFIGSTWYGTVYNRGLRQRVSTTSGPGATPSMNTNNYDLFQFTAVATAITSMTTNLTGTPIAGQLLMVQFTDNGTPQAITWGAGFESSNVALPTTTVANTLLTVGFIWNPVTSAWRCMAVA